MKRDTTICTLRAQRKTWPVIAAEVALSERQCRAVYQSYLKDQATSLVEQGPEAMVAEAMAELEEIAMRMAQIAEDPENQSVLIGASRLQAQVLRDKIALAQATGLLPHDLGTIRHLHDVRALVVEVVAIMRKRGVPVEVLREIQEVVAPVDSR